VRHRRTPLATALVLALAVPLMGAYGAGYSGVPDLPMSSGGAMIFNAGSADYAGYRIVVSPSGAALAVDGAGHASSELQTDITQKFFSDLAAAGPLDKLPAGECTTTSSTMGTTVEVNSAVVVSWNGKHTPALTCVSDPRAIRLLLDATTIQHALYVQAYRKRVIVRNGYPGPGSYAYRGSQYNGSSGQYTSAAGFNTTDPYNQGEFHMQPFQNESFNYNQFSSENFQFDTFHNEYPQASGVFTTNLPGSSPFTSLPTISPFNGTPYTNAPTLNPFAGYGPPSTNISNTSPFSASPFNGSPFSSPNLYSQ
jgi:hypothetical protein